MLIESSTYRLITWSKPVFWHFLEWRRDKVFVGFSRRLGYQWHRPIDNSAANNVNCKFKKNNWCFMYMCNYVLFSFIQLKADYMRLLEETPTIHSKSTWPEARKDIDHDPRYKAVNDDKLREQWFNEYVKGLVRRNNSRKKLFNVYIRNCTEFSIHVL